SGALLSQFLGAAFRLGEVRGRLAWLAVHASREAVFEPGNKSGDEVLVEIRSKAWAFLFERVVPKSCRYRHGITAKVEKVPRNQGIPTLMGVIGFGVEAACESPVIAVVSQAQFLVHSHCINQFAMTGADPKVGSTRSNDPIAHFGQFNDVPPLRLVLAPGERA